MDNYQRPWWLVVNKSAGLVTTVQDESKPGERVFLIRGEPWVQGLAWLTWGPAGALLIILALTGLAIALEVKEQEGAMRGLFIAAYLALPVLAWGGVALALNRLAKKHLQAERVAGAEECVIGLRQKQGELFYKTAGQAVEKTVNYAHICRVRVAPPIGRRGAKTLRLLLETDEGTVLLLNEALGTQAQKTDLAFEIQQALETYANK
ncbi:MAG: hypothetical protein JW953_02220 [Anaerolineae bacterium]|nr:hypothetical protein [Anaerolineae bacterium]